MTCIHYVSQRPAKLESSCNVKWPISPDLFAQRGSLYGFEHEEEVCLEISPRVSVVIDQVRHGRMRQGLVSSDLASEAFPRAHIPLAKERLDEDPRTRSRARFGEEDEPWPPWRLLHLMRTQPLLPRLGH